MKLSIVTGVCGNLEITRRWFNETIARTVTSPEIVVVSNGNTNEENEELRELMNIWANKLIIVSEPLGSSKALNLGGKVATGDVVAFIHNDLMIEEDGWDKYLLDFFASNWDNVGVVGYAGAQQLGAHDIYTKPYELTQLGRAHVWTALREWEPHGGHCISPIQVAVLDGLTMACTKELFNSLNGYDEEMIHHMYDNDFSLRAHFSGKENWVIPSTVVHVSGQTANMPRYNDFFFEKEGKRDGDIHRDSHEYFYYKWENLLPVIV